MTIPTYEQYKSQVAPYLRGWEAVLGHQRVGVYANSKTIEWALQDGLGTYFWQHNWGSPGKVAHPAAHVHQVEIDKRSVGGVGVDINHILKPALRTVGLTLPTGKYRQQTFCGRQRRRQDKSREVVVSDCPRRPCSN